MRGQIFLKKGRFRFSWSSAFERMFILISCGTREWVPFLRRNPGSSQQMGALNPVEAHVSLKAMWWARQRERPRVPLPLLAIPIWSLG